ncbi:MAG: DUF3611 family protein [Cyanophyceae cyanobacterium]
MSKSEITPPLSSKVQRVALSIKRAGRISFWLQLILGVIATVTLLFTSPALVNSRERTIASQFGFFCAAIGLVALAINIYFSWRYTQMARRIEEPDPARRPKKSDTLQAIRIGLTINLVGMLIAIIGAEALIGLVLGKSLSRPQLALTTDPSEFVNSIDLLIVQANTNTIAAHFSGIASSLWLLNRIAR